MNFTGQEKRALKEWTKSSRDCDLSALKDGIVPFYLMEILEKAINEFWDGIDKKVSRQKSLKRKRKQ